MECARGVIGRLAANIVVLNYTHLHAFTAFYHLFLSGNVTGCLATDETLIWERIVRPGRGRVGLLDVVPWVDTRGYSCSATSWLVRIKSSRRDADWSDRDGRAPRTRAKAVERRVGSGKRWAEGGRLTQLFPPWPA
jgi:hypothetical protein